jgi:hypothetical protein
MYLRRLHCISSDDLATALAQLSEQMQRPTLFTSHFFGKFTSRSGFRPFFVVIFTFWDGPSTEIASAPKRSAGMNEQDLYPTTGLLIHQNTSAFLTQHNLERVIAAVRFSSASGAREGAD